MKKFVVRDENNKEYEVEEVAEVKETDADESAGTESAALSEDEIGALKKLASMADKLIALVEIEKDEHADEPESEMLDEDEDEEVEEEEFEEVVDTDEEVEKMTRHDSKRSVGSIEKKRKTQDSDSHEHDVAQAWAKRYGGTK